MYKKLANNSLIITIGSLGSKVIYFFLIPLYTAYLTPSEYGMADFIVTTVSLLLPLVSFSIYDAVFRFVLDEAVDKEQMLKSATLFTIFCSGVLCLSVPVIYFVLDNGYYKIITLLGVISLILQAFQYLLQQYIRGIEKISLYTMSGIVAAVVVTVFSIIFLVVFNFKIYGYLLALIISNVASIIILTIGVPFEKVLHAKASIISVKTMLNYSIPLIPNSIMWYLTNFASRYVLIFILGPSNAGIYAASSKIPGALSALIYVFINAWEISAVDAVQSEKSSETREFYNNIFEIFVAIVSLVSGGMILFSRLIAFLFINHSYGNVWSFISVLLLSNVFLSYATFLGTNYIVSKDTNAVLKTTVYGAIANIVLSILLVPTIGTIGACIGNAFGFLVVLILRYKNLKKSNNLGVDFKNVIINSSLIILMVTIMSLISTLWLQVLLNVIFLLVLLIWNFRSLKLIFWGIRGRK